MAKSSASKGFVFCVKDVALLVLFASSLFKVSEGWCGDCEDDEVCCNNFCFYGSNCLGHPCTTGSYLDCSSGETCCNDVCVNGSDCIGQTCEYSAECGVGETCCNGKCTLGYDCSGQPCLADADCGSYGYCCGGTCDYDDCSADNTLWVVLGLIFGSVFLIFVISMFVRGIYCRGQRPAYGRVVEGQRVLPAASSTSYLGQSPPSYQQGYPYYPPPQYEQYPPYNEGTTKSSEPPPPYSTVPEGRLGGASATQNNYGAVQDSTLPV